MLVVEKLLQTLLKSLGVEYILFHLANLALEFLYLLAKKSADIPDNKFDLLLTISIFSLFCLNKFVHFKDPVVHDNL